MQDFKVSELAPVYGRNKSYYGKANVAVFDDGYTVLYSYTTAVCEISPDGKLHRTWAGYSATTMKHVNDFMVQYGFGGCGAERWRSFPVERARHWYIPFAPRYTTTYY